ncbi:hypothetical protein YTPLAS18_29510 [Nitrospira sp.]|nr:hypothetical protein YTPLAS18_29510 [Nitrospira sp.]
MENEQNNIADQQEFLRALEAQHRYLAQLEAQLDAFPDAAQNTPEVQELQKEFARVFADAMCREMFIEEQRKKGEWVIPTIKRHCGAA